MRFRVLSYNMHRAIGVDRRFKPDRIVQILEHGNKTALVTVRDKNSEGKVYFISGRIRHAVYESLTGRGALIRILKMHEFDTD